MKKLCVVQIAALGADLPAKYGSEFVKTGFDFRPLKPCFPAVTCPCQATFRTGTDPGQHGVVCNGVYSRASAKVDFWNQSAHLLPTRRIWDEFRRRGGTVGTICWQQSLGDDVELIVSPAPIHKHHGGMIQDCYSQPAGLYSDLCRRIGRRFNLFRYWGPTAGIASTRWIADATVEMLRDHNCRPDLLLTYLPHLDYVLQKDGPEPGRRLSKAVTALVGELCKIISAAEEQGYELMIWGDYAISAAVKPVFPNRVLREAGLMQVRKVRGMTYPDLYASQAFAMVDHQVAHIYVRNPQNTDAVRRVLAGIDGAGELLEHSAMPHARAGDFIMAAAEGAWFAYPWWENDSEAPEFATHVDIHNKIGFDPCELFWGKLVPPSVALDAGLVRGTHGLNSHPAAFASSAPDLSLPSPDLRALALAVGEWLSAAT